jgi:hypothetical protein
MYNGSPGSDIVSLRDYQEALFVVSQKTGGTNTGVATITIEACDDVSASNTSAIAFDYFKNEAAASSDDFGARQSVAATGFATTANKDAIYMIPVKASDLPDGYPFVRLKTAEAVDDPVLGNVLVILSKGPQSDPNIAPTVIA